MRTFYFPMPLARIVHWRPTEAGALIEACRSSGWKIDYPEGPTGATVTRGIRENMPDAVVIDLSRLPSHGREIAVWMRTTKRSRHVPIVFANGDAGKVEAIRQLLPDALYTTTAEVAGVLKSLAGGETRAATLDPVVPAPMMERYELRSVAQKLGIGPESTVGVMDPPGTYAKAVGPLPEGVELIENPRAVQP
ncbi:MAG: hypothetical protein M3N54_00375, partial [Acidobacteriota bacterium]|nr:hypothetical protein [Acidobacteriota bacterium]